VQELTAQTGIQIDTWDDHGRTPLSYAVAHDHGAVVRVVLEAFARLGVDKRAIQKPDGDGCTLRDRAKDEGYNDIVALLDSYLIQS
jgi:ankyrin repeat protein